MSQTANIEYKKRQVLQLLKDYRAWHTPGGGAMPAEDSHLRSAAYGPGGMTRTGQDFPDEGKSLLKATYRNLDAALIVVREYRYDLCQPLTRAYLGESADPSIITELRKKKERVETAVQRLRAKQKRLQRLHEKLDETIPRRISDYERTLKDIEGVLGCHDEAVSMLATILADRDLYVDFPKTMSIRQAERMEERNAQVASEYLKFRGSGMKKGQAKEAAGELYGISVRHVERILVAREG